MAHLLHLIGLCVGPFRLEVQDFLDSLFPEYVMASFYPLLKTKTKQQVLEIGEADIGV